MSYLWGVPHKSIRDLESITPEEHARLIVGEWGGRCQRPGSCCNKERCVFSSECAVLAYKGLLIRAKAYLVNIHEAGEDKCESIW